jgi:hypothetical protein
MDNNTLLTIAVHIAAHIAFQGTAYFLLYQLEEKVCNDPNEALAHRAVEYFYSWYSPSKASTEIEQNTLSTMPPVTPEYKAASIIEDQCSCSFSDYLKDLYTYIFDLYSRGVNFIFNEDTFLNLWIFFIDNLDLDLWIFFAKTKHPFNFTVGVGVILIGLVSAVVGALVVADFDGRDKKTNDE